MVVATASCAKPVVNVAPSPNPSAGGTVGYVRMGELVKHHPLYAQLTGYDESLEALDLRPVVPDVAKPNAAIASAQSNLQRELDAAAERTKTLLAQKSAAYQQREQQAIALALRSPAGKVPTAAQIVAEIDRNARLQSAGVATQANRDFESYRKTLVAQDNSELAAAQRALSDRAQREYRAKQDQLLANEAALSLEQANRDAPTRLSLRTRLSSLALDDAQRDAVRAQLADLDRKDADALAALKNRDAQTMAAYGAQLGARVQRDLQQKANEIHGRSMAKLNGRAQDIRREFGGPVAALPIRPSSPSAKADLTPQLRATIAALHANYQAQFNADAKATVAQFQTTRDDLRRRYDELRGIDTAAQSSAAAQVATLTKKRAELYGEMVAQIGREVRLLAQSRGISVVVTDPVANAEGVDLTSDAMKDIESLHE